jgi:hypothetical protein
MDLSHPDRGYLPPGMQTPLRSAVDWGPFPILSEGCRSRFAQSKMRAVNSVAWNFAMHQFTFRTAEAAGAIAAGVSDLALVNEMLEIARKHGHRPDARIGRLAEWLRTNMAPDGRWNERRLVLFTAYEDTRRWAEKLLAEALDDLQPDDRIASFTGATPLDRREELKRRLNAIRPRTR